MPSNYIPSKPWDCCGYLLEYMVDVRFSSLLDYAYQDGSVCIPDYEDEFYDPYSSFTPLKLDNDFLDKHLNGNTSLEEEFECVVASCRYHTEARYTS